MKRRKDEVCIESVAHRNDTTIHLIKCFSLVTLMILD